MICDGYASKFRKEYHAHAPRSRSKFYGIELKDAELPHLQHGHVLLGDGSPVLLYQIGTHETRALIDVPDNTLTASAAAGGIKNHLRNVVLPSLPKCVQPSFDAAIDTQIRSMPNSWLPPATNKARGMIMLGDAMNMRHPLTGGGMTVGLNDVVLLSDLLSPEKVPKLENTKLVLAQMSTFHWRRKDITAVINILAQALYALFAANGTYLPHLCPPSYHTNSSRLQPKSPSTWLFPLLPNGWKLHRWTSWSTRRHNSQSVHPLLPLFRCCFLRHLDTGERVQFYTHAFYTAVWRAVDTLDGYLCYWALYME